MTFNESLFTVSNQSREAVKDAKEKIGELSPKASTETR